MNSASANSERLARIRERFDFGEDDLEANRNGEFTARQRAPLERRRFSKAYVVVAVVLSLVAGWVASSSRRRETADLFRSRDLELAPFDWASGALAAGLTFAFLIVPTFGLWWYVARWPLRRGPKSITGPVHCYYPRIKRVGKVPAVRVGRRGRFRWFFVEESDHALFAHIPRATLYYAQGFGETVVYSIDPDFAGAPQDTVENERTRRVR